MVHRVQLRARSGQLFTYSGRSVLVTDRDGRVEAGGRHGLFVDNTRYLSRLDITADGAPLTPVSASPVGADAFLAYWEIPESDGVPAESVYLEARHFVEDGMRTQLLFRSYAPTPTRFALTIGVEADFADSEEAERGSREQSAETQASWDAAAGELEIRYCHERLRRSTVLTVEEAPADAEWVDGGITLPIELVALGSAQVTLVTSAVVDGRRLAATPRRSFASPAASLERLRADLAGEMPRLISSNASVSKAWETAVADLASLPYGLAGAPATPMAGLPLYLQFFGRDSLTIGWQSLMATSRLLGDALVANARWRGRRIDDWLDEEPGKMIHQARGGPLSVLGIDPFIRYYGDWATPPDFLIMLGQYLAWTGDRDAVRSLLPAARDAIDWCDRFGDLDGDGFLEYETRSAKGVKNQGWKDSHDAVVDERGQVVPNPIATSELQAYWYAGLQQAAIAFGAAGDLGSAAELTAKAHNLKRRFDRAFWMEDLGAYALGLDPDKRQIRSVGSNDGHLLASGIVPVERGRRIAARIMQPDMFSGWGVRTLSASHPAFNPFSYHRGSVWPVEQGTIAFGLARYGCWDELHRLAKGTFDAAGLFIEHRLPEVISGIQRDPEHPHPGIYPKSCEPQGWSASAVVMLVQALLGMVAVAPVGILVADPHLPAWLPDLRLEGLRVGGTTLSIQFRRTRSGRTAYDVTERSGRIRVLRQPPPQAPGAGPLGRALGVLRSIGHT